ncbi:MAG: PD-(D/E)XK nuclease family protein, partial [Arcobacteraceae bacterium]
KSVKNNIYYKKLNALIEYLNDSNIRTKEKLEFFGLDVKKVDDELRTIYFKPLTKQNFTLFLSLIGECEKELQEKIDEIVYKLDILLYNGDEILLSNAIKLFFDNISTISFDDVMGGKITVMGLLETRGVSFDGVIVVDFNDDKAPKRSVKDKFLSSHIKELVNLPTPQKRQNLQKYYYKTLFDNAKDVRISYIDDEQNMISRFAKELFDDSHITKNTQYSSILYSSAKLDKKNYEYVLDIDLSKFAFSATSLKDLLDCKRKYLYKHIYKIKDHTISLMPKGYEIGTAIHKILQNLFVKHKNLYDYKEIKQAIDFEISLEQNLVKNPMLELDLELYRRSLYKFAHIQEKRFQDGYTVVDTEKRFSVLHGGIKLEGVIDRIDRKAGEFYIIDYKTSKSLKVDTPKTYKETSDFQLEFYAL